MELCSDRETDPKGCVTHLFFIAKEGKPLQNMYSLQDIISIFLTACGGIGIIGTALVWIARAVGFLKRPEIEQDTKIEDHENRIKELERKANRDSEQISSVQEEMKVLLMGTHALLRHAIDGNDTDSLKQAENDIIKFLSNK